MDFYIFPSGFEFNLTQQMLDEIDKLRPNRERARLAYTIIGIILLVEFATLVSSYMQLRLLEFYNSGAEVTDDQIAMNDLRVQGLAITKLVLLAISVVTFLMWFRRAWYNLSQKVRNLSTTDGWAVGIWFIPIMNLYRPYQMMSEMFRCTRNLLLKHSIPFDGKLEQTKLPFWWALWIISGIMGQFVSRYGRSDLGIEQLITSTRAGMFLAIINIPLAILTIRIIKDYTSAEQLLNEVPDANAKP